jgi:5-methylcytosine-specific restriction endonuclease McrA
MPSEYVPVSLKKFVFDRAKGNCEYCRSQSRFAVDPLVMEHTYPVSRGGLTTAENLALSCQTCNNCKYTKTTALDSITNTIVPLFNPRKMQWNDHFTWTPDTTKMVGLTPIGRATIELLDTNRDSVVNMRRVLALMGYHPPES